jgi:predicted nucleic acid-binding protein
MTDVFADAFYYIALLNPADRWHNVAIEATRNLQGRLVTTSWILVEVADALCAPSIRTYCYRFLQQLPSEPNTLIIPGEPHWYERGLIRFGSRRDKEWSLTDCISFEVMTQYGIHDALTGDQHFQQAGFNAMMALNT